MKKYYVVEIKKDDEFTEAICDTKEEAIEKARKYWNRLQSIDQKNNQLEIRYADELWDDIDEEFYPDFQNYDTVEWKLTYRIHEIETNVTYDDIYERWQDAEDVIDEYFADDESDRGVRYQIIDSDGNIVDTYERNDKFDGLLSFSEAAEKWGIAGSTLRMAVADGRLKEGKDVQKFGRDWVVTEEAMERMYGEPKK